MNIPDIESVTPELASYKTYFYGGIEFIVVEGGFLMELLGVTDYEYGGKFHKAMLDAWLNYWDAIYYAAPREDFSLYDAACKALRENTIKRVLVVEDLS